MKVTIELEYELADDGVAEDWEDFSAKEVLSQLEMNDDLNLGDYIVTDARLVDVTG